MSTVSRSKSAVPSAVGYYHQGLYALVVLCDAGDGASVTVTVKFVLGPRVMDMRDVGGDESYLSGRLSTLLGLHRVFAAGNRPVPGVIILDQLSRPFYNPEKFTEEVVINSADRTDLKQYFDVLFKEIDEQKTLQVIVLEHAYFADYPRYQAAVTKRWNSMSGLIPADWPRITVDGTLKLAPHPQPPPKKRESDT